MFSVIWPTRKWSAEEGLVAAGAGSVARGREVHEGKRVVLEGKSWRKSFVGLAIFPFLMA
jgi:hypothetical protein